MAISSVQLYVAFSKLFRTNEPSKEQVLPFGVAEGDFDSVDQDNNEYLGIDEAMKNNSISDLLYSSMVSTYGSRDADDADRKSAKASKKDTSSMIDTIDTNISSSNNPFV